MKTRVPKFGGVRKTADQRERKQSTRHLTPFPPTTHKTHLVEKKWLKTRQPRKVGDVSSLFSSQIKLASSNFYNFHSQLHFSN
jgi:hypothetical protein